MGSILTKSIPLLTGELRLAHGNELTAMNGPLQTPKIEVINNITNTLRDEITFYKNTMFPVIKNAIEIIEQQFNQKIDPRSQYPTVTPLIIPDYIVAMDNVGMFDNLRDGVSLGEYNIDFPDTVDVTKYISLLSSEGYETDVKEYMNRTKLSDFEEAYNTLKQLSAGDIGVNIFRNPSNHKKLFNLLSLVIALRGKEAIDGTKGSLDDYRLMLNNVALLLKRMVKSLIFIVTDSAKSNRFVIYQDRKEVIVNPTTLEEFNLSGGTIEMLYG